MTYIKDMTWANISALAGFHALSTIETIVAGREAYDKWIEIWTVLGANDSIVASGLGRPTADIQAVTACLQAIKELDDALNNTAITTDNRTIKMRKFT